MQQLLFLATDQEWLYFSSSVFVWFRDGLGEPLGDYNEKGGILTTDPGCKYLSERKARRGINEIQRPSGNGDGAEPASPPRLPESLGGTSQAPRIFGRPSEAWARLPSSVSYL